MAHNNFRVLEILIRLLDDESNDIYLHVDLKVSIFDKEYFSKIPQKSNIYFIDRMKVNWGGLSQVICEISLLEKAISQNYKYYHLLSGVDLPIKSQKYIHNFFEQNYGKEFVGIEKDWDKSRVKYFHLFNEIGRKKDFLSIIKRLLNSIIIQTQKKLCIVRNKNINFAKGANWFSITHNLAEFTIRKKDDIYKLYANTIFCDEVFLQTLIINSYFKRNLYGESSSNEYDMNMRHIDWSKGNPYIFRVNDFNELMSSNKLFARKFDENVDMDIVNMIYDEITSKSMK